jgi:hypothetical protein
LSWLNEIESYIEFFKKKRKFMGIEGIINILNSQEYYDFIEKLSKHYNLKVHLNDNIQLSPKCYLDVTQVVDNFWESLLGKISINEFRLNCNSLYL